MLANISIKPIRLCLAILFIFSVLSVGSYCNVFAASTINVQGKLTNKEGNPITGIQDLYFRLYNVSIATTPLWTEQHRINLGNDGLFNVRLGEVASLDTLSFDKQLYLGISINGENEMLPRQVLTSSPYALGSIGDFSVGKKLLVGGNVGIGTASPGAKLNISEPNTRILLGELTSGNTFGAISMASGGMAAGTYALTSNGSRTYVNAETGGEVGLRINNDSKLVVSTNGNVGIGTASPNAKLSIADNVAVGFLNTYGEYQTILYDGGTAASSYGFGIKPGTMVFNTNGGYSFDRTGNATSMVIDSSGNVGIGTVAPGAKLSFGDLNDGRNTADGITWYNPSPLTYGIYRSAGAWAAPNYQQLNLSWSTGIVIDGGSAYGKSGTVLQPNGGNVGIGTANPTKKLEVNGTLSWNLEYFESPEYSVPYFADGQNNTVKVADLTWKFCYLSSYSHDGSNSAYARVYRGADGWYLNYGKPPSSKGGISVRVSGVK